MVLKKVLLTVHHMFSEPLGPVHNRNLPLQCQQKLFHDHTPHPPCTLSHQTCNFVSCPNCVCGKLPNPAFLPSPQVRAKEAILVTMALTLLVCSILLFFKHWKKNYRDINQLPYYAYLYQKEEVQFEPEVNASFSAGCRGKAFLHITAGSPTLYFH